MSSMKNLDDTFNFLGINSYDKANQDDQEKSKARESLSSTVPDPESDNMSSPPVIAPYTDWQDWEQRCLKLIEKHTSAARPRVSSSDREAVIYADANSQCIISRYIRAWRLGRWSEDDKRRSKTSSLRLRKDYRSEGSSRSRKLCWRKKRDIDYSLINRTT
ncbi:hypothetical protein Tco_0000554 [Tanacetum coccineum]